MTFDYFAENPYKKDESRFNSDKYKDFNKMDKNLLYKLCEKLDLL